MHFLHLECISSLSLFVFELSLFGPFSFFFFFLGNHHQPPTKILVLHVHVEDSFFLESLFLFLSLIL